MDSSSLLFGFGGGFISSTSSGPTLKLTAQMIKSIHPLFFFSLQNNIYIQDKMFMHNDIKLKTDLLLGKSNISIGLFTSTFYKLGSYYSFMNNIKQNTSIGFSVTNNLPYKNTLLFQPEISVSVNINNPKKIGLSFSPLCSHMVSL